MGRKPNAFFPTTRKLYSITTKDGPLFVGTSGRSESGWEFKEELQKKGPELTFNEALELMQGQTSDVRQDIIDFELRKTYGATRKEIYQGHTEDGTEFHADLRKEMRESLKAGVDEKTVKSTRTEFNVVGQQGDRIVIYEVAGDKIIECPSYRPYL